MTATATEVGTYSAGPLLPGDYVITASHPHWQLDPASITHQLSLDSPQLTSPFSIMGYRVSGTVTSRSGPVAGIQVRVSGNHLDMAWPPHTHPYVLHTHRPTHIWPTRTLSANAALTAQLKLVYGQWQPLAMQQ